jgi:type IV pilus assembly protein PilY1
MNYLHRYIVRIGALAGTVGTALPALAQVDVNPPRPNVLLLVDSSGSMEYTTSSQTFPVCNPAATNTNPNVIDRSRWINLVEALTGNIPDYRCESVSRNTSRFLNEYKISGTMPVGTINPADYLYPIPYHRPMSGTCAPTPGANQNSINFCSYTSGRPCAATDCTFPDTTGGLLDAFAQQIRFGLMTFDTLPSASSNLDGTWTYTWGSPVLGAPKDCTATKPQDVGARNAKAPLWEGRLIAFGPPQASNELDLIEASNQQIQQVLLATRPFGATPIAGMLKDARDYFWNDDNPDGSGNLPPRKDPYVLGECRTNYIILLTDGEPNMDLRPYCESETVNSVCGPKPGDCCPFEKTEDIARSLALGTGGPKVQTFVIGFAVSQTSNEGTPVECENLTENDLTSATGLCAKTTNSALKVCCKLNQIAYNGDPDRKARAYFADSAEGLRTALADILDKASKGTTSRTFPVFASATGSNSSASSFRFFTSFKSRIAGTGLWPGVIERQRFVCTAGAHSATPVNVDSEKGDDFARNVNSSNAPARRFFTVVANTASGAIHSTYSIRTNATSASRDGAGTYSGTLVNGNTATFSSNVPALALDVAASPCIKEAGMTADKCRDRYLKWLIGTDNGSVEKYHRCPTLGGANCNLVADVYHSVPTLVNRPSENLRDESYQKFALTTQRTRPLVLYTSTNDGFLHAFKVASNDPTDSTAEAKVETRTNNELWAFIPPAVLPKIPDEYPNVHQPLLDGAPVTRDVAGYTESTSGVVKFERNLSTLSASDSVWRTILVQSFGGSYPGYFALDVTDPVVGPKFLWQLTKDSSGAPFFGETGATPTIATLYFDPDSSGKPREVSVAILPGGNGGTPPDPTLECDRADQSFGAVDFSPKIRTRVPCYESSAGTTDRDAAKRARSLTIVRLDTGEIIRTFRRSASDAPASIRPLVTVSPLDAPITGQPVAYPGWTGAIADRAFVGDRDGSLWRVDLTSTDPTKWSMKLFFDAYRGKAAHAGQPIATAPIVSTNESGEVVVAFATGNQEDLVGTAGTETFLYSIREKATDVLSATVIPAINWYYRFTGGERITGPLTLFSNGIYFSTYAPPVSGNNACSSGTSRVGGMHFVTAAGSTEDPIKSATYFVSDPGVPLSRGGYAMLPKNGESSSDDREQFYDQTDAIFEQGSVIFGVGIAQVPSCFTEGETLTDPFFGTSYKPTLTTSPATYQLVIQTGNRGTQSTGGATNVKSVNLPPPDTSPRIDTWALVME